MTDLPKFVWMQKNQSGLIVDYWCEVISFSKGIVTGKVLKTYPEWAKGEVGKVISGRISKCFVRENVGRCRWFMKGGVLSD